MQFFKSKLMSGLGFDDATSENCEYEIAPGVVIERRTVLGGGLGIWAMLLSAPLRGFCQEPRIETKSGDRDTPQGLEALISQLRPAARSLVKAENPDEEKCVALAIDELAKVNELEPNRFTPSHKKGWDMDFQAYVPPLLLYQIRMSPNSVIDLHDHRHHNGALSIRKGNALVRSFDIFQGDEERNWDIAAGRVPAMEEEFLIQEKGERTVKSGQSVGLTRTRDNIHQIEAGPDGCLMYDLFTNFKMNAQSFEIKWDGQYFDRNRKLCKVVWIPPDHSHD